MTYTQSEFGRVSSIARRLWMSAIATMVVVAGLEAIRADDIGKKGVRRAFYLTPSTHDGTEGLNACAAGYHMASLWEILDPSNLHYDVSLGLTRDDSGSGPPTEERGWVRTGTNASSGFGYKPGQANCTVWSSLVNPNEGTTLWLPDDWSTSSPVSPISPWVAQQLGCSASRHVWCVED